MGLFSKLKEGLTKTRDHITSGMDAIFSGFSSIDDDFYEELEETMIMGDIGVRATEEILEELKEKVHENKVKNPADCKQLLIDTIKEKMDLGENAYDFENRKSIIILIGVNGVGKTTSAGKIAAHLRGQGRKVILAAADTFRAAAIEQLTEWANRSQCDIIAQSEGSDPAAVIFDAVAAAKAVNYSGAGTIEFLVDKNRRFYFLEMNTRLQVEHPITEEVVGVDLVKEQIRIANDEVLHLKQEELFQRGHAIECRICAEDTENNFMPSPGVIKQLTEPNGIGVRIDSYVYDGYEIPIYYDPMIGKLIVWATTRQYAIERMRRVLYEYKITGVKTNLAYLKRIMHVPDFVKGEYNTLFIEKNARMLVRTNTANEELENIAMIAAYMDYLVNLEENVSAQLPDARPISRWREFGLQKGVLRI